MRWPIRSPLDKVYHWAVNVSESVKRCALGIGFDLAGIAPLEAGPDLEFSRQWVEKGYGGEMAYLANPKRDDPHRVLPTAKSVICVGLVYNAPLPYSTDCAEKPDARVLQSDDTTLTPSASPAEGGWGEGAPRAWISRYAWGHDYHQLMRAKLEELRSAVEALAPGVETRVYVDTGPIVERAFARLSGIGWMGKNTCLINQEKGSWFFLGVILTSLELSRDFPAPDRCGSCTRCIEACPTGALVEPYVMDASRCIAYFTIELKGSIPVEFRSSLGSNVFGCDICQDVCPWNVKGAATTDLAEFQPWQVESSSGKARFSSFNPPLEALASLSEDDFRRFFVHSPVKRVKYRGWLRNLCVAMGNSGDARFVPWLERASEYPDATVRKHALWALERLRVPQAQPQ